MCTEADGLVQIVCCYSVIHRWLEDVLDSCQANMLQYDGPELVTLLWSLAQLHHQPGTEWLSVFCEACEGRLAALSGSQLAQLLYAFAQLKWEPPAAWMDAHLKQVGVECFNPIRH